MTEARTVQLVVCLLGAVALVLVGGLVALALLERDVPDALTTLAGSAVGALGALLVSTRSGPAGSGEPAPVPVTLADEPVAVELAEPELELDEAPDPALPRARPRRR